MAMLVYQRESTENKLKWMVVNGHIYISLSLSLVNLVGTECTEGGGWEDDYSTL